MSNLLPKSRLVKVEMTIALPISATLDQVEEWVNMESGARGSMSGDNPLADFDIEAISPPVLTDTRNHLHSEAIDNQDGSHTIRKWVGDAPAWGPTGIEVAINASKRS